MRLAQELGIDNTLLYELDVKDSKGDVPQSWHKERILRTWICRLRAAQSRPITYHADHALIVLPSQIATMLIGSKNTDSKSEASQRVH